MSTDKASHTPGPWRVAESGVRDVGGYICFINKPTHYADQEERYAREVEERKANAKWIAALPDLVAVCKDLQRLMLVIESSVRWGDLKNHPQVEALLLANVAAIAKAEHL